MLMYRILHKPTGLYFSERRWVKVDGKYTKTNLVKKGRLYSKFPAFVKDFQFVLHVGEKLKVAEADWTIEQL